MKFSHLFMAWKVRILSLGELLFCWYYFQGGLYLSYKKFINADSIKILSRQIST